jgi:hypothetical protein
MYFTSGLHVKNGSFIIHDEYHFTNNACPPNCNVSSERGRRVNIQWNTSRLLYSKVPRSKRRAYFIAVVTGIKYELTNSFMINIKLYFTIFQTSSMKKKTSVIKITLIEFIYALFIEKYFYSRYFKAQFMYP